jgi:transposase
MPSEERIARLLKRKSLFIVATNELDDEALSAEEMLEGYKGQVQVERGFRYLKDPQLLADSLYLQKERRIMASLMIMTLCLMVYSALEWRIREGLQAQDKTFPDQKGNPTQRPTARWRLREIPWDTCTIRRSKTSCPEHKRSPQTSYYCFWGAIC